MFRETHNFPHLNVCLSVSLGPSSPSQMGEGGGGKALELYHPVALPAMMGVFCICNALWGGPTHHVRLLSSSSSQCCQETNFWILRDVDWLNEYPHVAVHIVLDSTALSPFWMSCWPFSRFHNWNSHQRWLHEGLWFLTLVSVDQFCLW